MNPAHAMHRFAPAVLAAVALTPAAMLGCQKRAAAPPPPAPSAGQQQQPAPPAGQPAGLQSQPPSQLLVGRWQSTIGGGWWDFRADGKLNIGDGTGRSREARYRWTDGSSVAVSHPDGRPVTTLRIERVTGDTLVMSNDEGTRNEYRRAR